MIFDFLSTKLPLGVDVDRSQFGCWLSILIKIVGSKRKPQSPCSCPHRSRLQAPAHPTAKGFRPSASRGCNRSISISAPTDATAMTQAPSAISPGFMPSNQRRLRRRGSTARINQALLHHQKLANPPHADIAAPTLRLPASGCWHGWWLWTRGAQC